MKNETYTQYSEAQLNKIGNTAIYLSERIQHLSKTKFLKLLKARDTYLKLIANIKKNLVE